MMIISSPEEKLVPKHMMHQMQEAQSGLSCFLSLLMNYLAFYILNIDTLRLSMHYSKDSVCHYMDASCGITKIPEFNLSIITSGHESPRFVHVVINIPNTHAMSRLNMMCLLRTTKIPTVHGGSVGRTNLFQMYGIPRCCTHFRYLIVRF